jgi:CRISPR-associated protein Csd2
MSTKNVSSPVVTKRISCMLVIEVSNANPNGDPDFDGAPRKVGFGNHGLMTDVSIKRRFRDLFVRPNSPAFKDLSDRCGGIDPEMFRILESPTRGIPDLTGATDREQQTEAQRILMDAVREDANYLTDHYGDVRLFGTTLLEMNNASEEEEPSEEEEDSRAKKAKKGKKAKVPVAVKLTGPVTITPAISVHPIVVDEKTLTKLADVDEKKHDKGAMGMAPAADKRVVYGVYTARLEVCVQLAQRTKLTEKDLQILKNSIREIWDQSPSHVRPAGSIRFRHIWWCEHTNALGSYNVWNYYERLTPTVKEGVSQVRNANDLNFPQAHELTGMPNGIEDLACA